MRQIRTYAVSLGMAAILGLASAAAATSVAVEYSNQDLSSRHGASGLYQRIRAAADRVCQTTDAAGRIRLDKDCVGATVDQTVRRLAAPALTDAYLRTALGQAHEETTLSPTQYR
jgi:UrcA family protein